VSDKPKLAISFSGGRTSAVMTHLLINQLRVHQTHEVRIQFANTGCEHPATLDFVRACQDAFGWDVNWLEAKVNPERGAGVRHTVVDYETASREGEPFRKVVEKYGIFNRTSPACTSRLKTDVFKSFLQSEGFKFGKHVDHRTSIGIRYDEAERMSSRKEEFKLWYPLIDHKITKRDVALEIKKWGFDLQIPHDAFGNCTWCWKKSLRKHLTLAQQDPSVFDFPRRMEQEFGHVKGDTAAAKEGRRYWFKDYMTADEIIELSKTKKFTPYEDDAHDHAFDETLDAGGGACDSGACDVYGEID
jgi:3'-phosphoadenosine 5'-phosphosulfate sulfotransferase (PAPS reductase)/FAD synthetase